MKLSSNPPFYTPDLPEDSPHTLGLPENLKPFFNKQPPATVIPWQAYVKSLYPGCELYNIIYLALQKQALDFNLTYYNKSFRQSPINDNNETIYVIREKLHNELINAGGNLLYLTNETYIYAWPDTGLQLTYYISTPDISIWFNFWTTNPQRYEELINIKDKYFKEPIYKPEGKAYALLPINKELVAQPIGVGGLPLIKDNYRPEVVKSYKDMVTTLKMKDPSGRLFIITGPPGTGKTFLIRSLLHDLPEQKFLIIPSNMISSMAGPELLQALIQASKTDQDNVNVPVALIVEDADSCLSTRGSDNISSISSILNLSDGILGRLLDLRIICTTNAKIEDFDNAVLRSGRLGAKIEVNFLDKEQAQEVYKRLEGKNEINWNKKEYYPLSDVYALAKGEQELLDEMKGPITNKTKIGFSK